MVFVLKLLTCEQSKNIKYKSLGLTFQATYR